MPLEDGLGLPDRVPRPSKHYQYRPEYVQVAEQLWEHGSHGKVFVFELAQLLKVSIATIWKWTLREPDFKEVVIAAQLDPNGLVEASLYRRATGYSYESEQVNIVKIKETEHDPATGKVISSWDRIETVRTPIIEHIPPDVKAAEFILKNVAPDRWRDRQQVEHTGKDGGPLTLTISRDDAGVIFGPVVDVTPERVESAPTAKPEDERT